jgi:hydroxymethylpyrimidine/phosphomethylpyrimidine kinase
MVAESGDRLLEEGAEATMRETVVPEARLVTPNLDEAEILLDRPIEGRKEMAAACEALLDLGPGAVLLKGGHLEEADGIVDLLHDGEEIHEFEKPRVDTTATHGTGCTLSAGATAGLAKDRSLTTAVEAAEALVHRGLQWGLDLGDGAGPVHHLADARHRADLGRTMRAVDAAADLIAAHDPTALLPEVGTNLAAAPRYASRADEIVGLRGRISATLDADGAPRARRTADGVAPGASGHVGDFLAALRKHDPEAGACINVRHGPDVLGALEELDLDTFSIPWEDEPDDVAEAEGATMPWEAQAAMEGREATPDALVDPGRRGKEAMVKLVDEEPGDLAGAVLEVQEIMADRAGD